MKFTFDARFYFDARRTCMSVFKFETPNKLVQNMKFVETEESQVIKREINSDGKLLEVSVMNPFYKKNYSINCVLFCIN